MTDYNALAKIKRAATQGKRVSRPSFGAGGCWAWVRQPSTGSAFGRIYGNYDTCKRGPRKGHLTCAQHADRDEEAQHEKGRGTP